MKAPENLNDYDANKVQNQRYKAAPGVKFVEFDEHGLNKAEGLSKYVYTKNDIPDVFIPAPQEMIDKVKERRTGVVRDYDMDPNNIDDESKSDNLCI